MITEVVYIGHDNTIDLLLKAKNPGEAMAAVDLASVTRMVVELSDETEIDSEVEDAGTFDWDTGTTGKVILALGGVEKLTAGKYVATLVVYDPTNADGIVWGKFRMTVKPVVVEPPAAP